MNTLTVEQEITHWADTWIDAERRGDVALLEQTLVNSFMAVGPLGFVLNKEQWIARHRSGDMTYSALALDSVSVRLYGDTAVLIGRQTQDAAYRGNSVMTQLRATLVMVRKQGNWQLASTHFSSITPPPGGTRG